MAHRDVMERRSNRNRAKRQLEEDHEGDPGEGPSTKKQKPAQSTAKLGPSAPKVTRSKAGPKGSKKK